MLKYDYLPYCSVFKQVFSNSESSFSLYAESPWRETPLGIESFSRHEFDVIVGSFSNTYLMTESDMLGFIAQQALVDLREAGFGV